MTMTMPQLRGYELKSNISLLCKDNSTERTKEMKMSLIYTY